MNEEPTPYATNGAYNATAVPAPTPEPESADKRPQRIYACECFGRMFLVRAADHAQVRAHIARKARALVDNIRVADFHDGIESVACGIAVETAGEEDAADLFSAPGA